MSSADARAPLEEFRDRFCILKMGASRRLELEDAVTEVPGATLVPRRAAGRQVL